ncbi:MAG: O-antigen ligase family protein [Bacteroidia bacterium]|nr:O-antigen ligase family protein [Bacteroidia bacterium]
MNYDKIRTLVLCSAFLALLFSLTASSLFIIIFIVLTVWEFRDPKIYIQQNKLGWLFFLIFIFHLISVFWTEDMHRYVQFIERNLSWVLFPALLSNKLKESIDLKLFKKVFFIGLVIFALINELIIVYDFITTTVHEKTVRLFFSRYYQLSNSIRISDIHYPYLSLYNTIAIIFGISIIKRKGRSFWIAIGLLLLLFYNFQLGSRVFFVINFIIFFYACVIIFLKGDKYLRIFLLCILAGILWYAKPVLAHSYARFVSRLEATYAPRNSLSEFYRPDRWKICVELIKDNLLIGLGPADVEKSLQAKYIENNFTISVSEKYNSHNQYLDYTLRFGIFGGLLLITTVGLLCINAFLNKEYDMMAIFLVFAIAMMTENYLSVQRGIVPFCMLALLFHNKYVKNKPLERLYNNN